MRRWHILPIPPPPPALLSRASFADADEQAAALTGWNQSYLQLSRGAFGGEVRQLEFAGLRLFVESLRESVYQTGQIREGALAIGCRCRLKVPACFAARPAMPARCMCFRVHRVLSSARPGSM
jgi:AraC family ethanolamine operon transcriptional activator